MREILFRGKRVSDGEWLYGSLLQVNRKGATECCIHSDRYSHLIDHATVGQYTGLTDKNGKKIFEGDIIENIDGRAIVFFDKTPCGFYMRFLDAYDDTPLDMGEMWDETEVIGNIHDNPELMGVEK